MAKNSLHRPAELIGSTPLLRQADEWELYCYRKAGVPIKVCAEMFEVSLPTVDRIIAKFRKHDDCIDTTAEQLWHGVAEATDIIGDLISNIPAARVQGDETRNELRQAQALLSQTAALLERTVARYEPPTAAGSRVSP